MKENLENKTLGQKITEVREYRGFTQIELASLSKITPQYLSNIEADKFLPSPKTLKKVIKFLRISWSTIFPYWKKAKDKNENNE